MQYMWRSFVVAHIGEARTAGICSRNITSVRLRVPTPGGIDVQVHVATKGTTYPLHAMYHGVHGWPKCMRKRTQYGSPAMRSRGSAL